MLRCLCADRRRAGVAPKPPARRLSAAAPPPPARPAWPRSVPPSLSEPAVPLPALPPVDLPPILALAPLVPASLPPEPDMSSSSSPQATPANVTPAKTNTHRFRLVVMLPSHRPDRTYTSAKCRASGNILWRTVSAPGGQISGYGTERLRSRLVWNLTYVNKGLNAFVRSGAWQSTVARSTAGTGFAPGERLVSLVPELSGIHARCGCTAHHRQGAARVGALRLPRRSPARNVPH